MPSEKVTLAQAAGQIGVHINTIKTWRRSGYLKSAELIIEHGVEVWHVDLGEAIQVAQSKKKNRVDSSINTGGYPIGYPENSPPVQESTLPLISSTAVTTAQEQTITFMRESVVRPLVEANERQAAVIGELREELGTLKEQLRQAKEQLEAAQTAPQPPQPIEPLQPDSNATQPQIAPEPAQTVQEHSRKGFWARVFGG